MIKVVELRNYVEILSGFAFDSNLFNDSQDGIPLIRIRDVGKNFSKTFFAGQYDEKYIVKNGDYLISMDGDFRLSEWKGVDSLLNQRVCKISVTKKNELSEKYLLHFLPKELKLIEDTTSFATVKHLSVEKVKKIQIPLPPLPQQHKIANILDAAHALRQNDKALIAKYDELTQALFLDMFGDPVSNPKGWDKVELKKLVVFENGDRSSNYPSGDEVKVKGEIPFINSKNIKDNRFDNNITSFISEQKFKSLSRGKLQKGDVIISLRGSIGNCCIFESEYNSGFINAQLMIIRCLQDISNLFLHRYLANSTIQLTLKNLGQGAAVPQLTSKQIGELCIYHPPIDLQNQFAERVAVIEEQKAIAQKSLEHSEELFNSLLQKAFKGELV